MNGKVLPWNRKWKAAPGSDAQIILLDPKSGIEYDFWRVKFKGGIISASNGSMVPGDYRTKIDGNPLSRGIGIQYLAMLVRPEEIAQGEIRHALSMAIRNPNSRYSVPPATKLEGKPSASPDGIPEGMRFALDVSDEEITRWVNSLPNALPYETRRSALIIARALRDYGWFITDTAGGASFQFEANVSAHAKWKALGLDERTPIKIGGKEYPRDLLDGLLAKEKIRALVSSGKY